MHHQEPRRNIMHSQVTEPRNGTKREFKPSSPCKANRNQRLLTKLSCIVLTVIKEKLMFRWDVPRGAKVNFSIMRISYQVLLFPVPMAITTAMKKSPPEIMIFVRGKEKKQVNSYK